MIDINTLIAWGGSYKKYNAEETIFWEGSTCYYYYQLVKGKVLWMNLNDDGKEFIQNMIEPDECFGELPLFDGEPYAASSIALEDCMVIRLPKDLFLQLIKENHEIHMNFTKLLAQRLRYKFLLLKTIAFENPEIRISILLNHYKNKHQLIPHQPFQVNLTRQQIANMTGLRVETVIRTIRNLNERGELRIDHGKVFM